MRQNSGSGSLQKSILLKVIESKKISTKLSDRNCQKQQKVSKNQH